jgi:hypothetical protein
MGIETIATVAGLAASAAGTGLSMAGAAKAQDAMEKQIQNQIAYQQSLQARATPVFQRSLQESSPEQVGRQMKQGEDQANALYRDVQSLPLGSALSPISEGQQRDTRTRDVIAAQNQAQAGLQGVSGMQSQQWLKNAEAQNQLGVFSNLANSSSQATPYLVQLAGHAGDSLAGLGSLMSTAGTLGAMYGASKGGLGSIVKPKGK